MSTLVVVLFLSTIFCNGGGKINKNPEFFSPLTGIMVLCPKIAGPGTPQTHRKANNPDPCAPRQAMYKAITPDIITACQLAIEIMSVRIMVSPPGLILPVTTGAPVISVWSQDWPEPPGYGGGRWAPGRSGRAIPPDCLRPLPEGRMFFAAGISTSLFNSLPFS